MTFIPLNIYLKILTSKVCEVVALVALFCVSLIINEIKSIFNVYWHFCILFCEMCHIIL